MDERLLKRVASVREHYDRWFQERLPTVPYDEAADMLDERRNYLPSGATEAEIQFLLRYAGHGLPQDYLEFLRMINGFVGYVYGVSRIIRANETLNVRKEMPNFLVFGGNGGPDLYLLDLRMGADRQVAMTPAIAITPTRILDTWPTFTDWFLDYFPEAAFTE